MTKNSKQQSLYKGIEQALTRLFDLAIAETTKVSKRTIDSWIKSKNQELGKLTIIPESLQIYNIPIILKKRHQRVVQ